MATPSPAFGPLDEVLGTLLETWNHRYHFEMNRKQRRLLLSKPPGNEVLATELPDGRIRVAYRASPDQAAEQDCSVAHAVRLIDALMARESLHPLTVPADPLPPEATPPTPSAKGGWLARLLRRIAR